MLLFVSLPLLANLVIFSLLATVIWLAGTRLSCLADAIGNNTGMSRALIM